MTPKNRALVDKLYRSVDPFSFFSKVEADIDFQGWKSKHPYLERAVSNIKPSIVVEVGVWKGGSSITLANALQANALDAVIISVDTWLGSEEHWLNDKYFPSLRIQAGIPQLQRTFMNNVVAAGLTHYILPLPLDSINAARVLAALKLQADIIHIDAAHDRDSVERDLLHWWPLLAPKGILIADDYYTTDDPKYPGAWPGVRLALDSFAANEDLTIEHAGGKALIVKPQD